MDNLSEEQQKRIALLQAYEAQSAPARQARNDGLDQHEQDFREKWQQLQSSMEASRSELQARLKDLGASDASIAASVAIELAKLTEGYYADKDKAARDLEGTFAQPQSWLDFLKESKLVQVEDPTLDTLIKEAEESPDAGLEGLSKPSAPNIVLSDLHAREGKDGVMEYARGLVVAVRDVGDRLDVRKTDDRDIEAALKIAAQKFDLDKGLRLTGDTAFKVRAAEISGRLGYPLQNTEPEVLRAWMKGQTQSQGLGAAHLPRLDAGITGDPVQNLTVARPDQAVLRADERTIEVLAKRSMFGIDRVGENEITMPHERMLLAHACIKDLGYEALNRIARADLDQADGGLDSAAAGLLRDQGILDAEGKLTQLGTDVVLVRDDRVLRERDALEPFQREELGPHYKTSGDYVREATAQAQELTLEQENTKGPGQPSPTAHRVEFEEGIEL